MGHAFTEDEMRRGTLNAIRSPKTPECLKKALIRRALREGWVYEKDGEYHEGTPPNEMTPCESDSLVTQEQ